MMADVETPVPRCPRRFAPCDLSTLNPALIRVSCYIAVFGGLVVSPYCGGKVAGLHYMTAVGMSMV